MKIGEMGNSAERYRVGDFIDDRDEKRDAARPGREIF